MTPSCISKINKDLSDWHNCGGHGSLLHLLWDCPAVKTFWLGITKVLTDVFKVHVPVCPITCLLGQSLEHVKSRSTHYFMNLGFLSAKRIILMNWKQHKPSFLEWISDYLDLLSMECASNLLFDYDTNTQGHWDIARTFMEKEWHYTNMLL